ncbi:hypothetical protein WMY93_006772 [Mugilogobius chulae]|uniref:Uncharacterized protein n=1 Tax=Mugilogobius chulae TaxID=88201 RepID=A0AAW0PUF1_9GOBI
MDLGRLLFVLFLVSSGIGAEDTEIVQTDCSLSQKHKADVLLLLHGFNNTSADSSQVTGFLETLVRILGQAGLDSVRFALVKCDVTAETVFELNSHTEVSSALREIQNLSQSRLSPADPPCDLLEVYESIFQLSGGGRDDAPDALVLISDTNLEQIDFDTMESLYLSDVKVFLFAVKDTKYSEIDDIAEDLNRPELFSLRDIGGFNDVLKELAESFCRWIKHNTELAPESLQFSHVQARRAGLSWTYSNRSVSSFYVLIKPDFRGFFVPGHKRTTELLHLKPNTDYEVQISAHESGKSPPVIGHVTTEQDSVRLSGGPGSGPGPGRCSGSPQVLVDHTWTSVCSDGFGRTEAEVLCRELDCGAVSELQGAPFTQDSAVRRSFHCRGAETELKQCESSETLCSATANVTCTDDVTLAIIGYHCYGTLMLRHEDQWREVDSVDQDQDLDFGSALCETLGCGVALGLFYPTATNPVWLLDPECVKQRAGIKRCLIQNSNITQNKKRMILTCSEHFPDLRISLSSEDDFQSLGHKALVRSGANFTVSCSSHEPFRSNHLTLFSPTGNHTLNTVNHVLFVAIGPAHKGNYTCGYSRYRPMINMKDATLHIGPGEPDLNLILRAVIQVLILVITTTALCVYFQPFAPCDLLLFGWLFFRDCKTAAGFILAFVSFYQEQLHFLSCHERSSSGD